MRIATLLASATEIVCGLGLRDRLVGVSHACDHPASITSLPRLTRARLDGAAPSRVIHDDVERLVRDALAIYDIDLDALRAANPDVLVTQDLCAVCAVDLGAVRRAAAAVLGHDVTIVSLSPRRLDDVWRDVERVGRALGLGMTAQAVANGYRGRVDAVRRRVAALPERPWVVALEWLDPLMVGGLWMPDLIEAAGGRALIGEAGQPGVVLEPPGEPPRHRGLVPDVIVVKPCGFDLARTLAELPAVLAELARIWPRVPVVAADGNALFNRSGPRLVESVETLAAILHPEAFADLATRHAARFTRAGAASGTS